MTDKAEQITLNSYTELEKSEAFKKNATLSVSVLANLVKIVEAAVQRGAFNKPNEMTFVGSTYDIISGGLMQALAVTKKELDDKKLETIAEEDETEETKEVIADKNVVEKEVIEAKAEVVVEGESRRS